MTAWHRVRRWFVAVALALTVMWIGTGGVSTAHAEAGTPAGWDLATASETRSVGKVTLRYDPALADEAAALLHHIPGWWSEIEQALAGDLDDELRIYYVRHAGRIAEATGMPRWAAGVAHSESGEIVIAQQGPNGARTDLDSLMRHELAHVALHRATAGQPLPRWLHEGMAESFGSGIDLMRSQTLAGAIFGPGVPPLEQLETDFRGIDPVAANVGYAAARDFVNHLRYRDEHGANLRQLLTELRHGLNLEAAFIKAYGRSLHELDREWRTGLTGRFVWFPIVSSGGMPLALISPLIAVAAIRRRRQLQAGWARLAREDAAERARGTMRSSMLPALHTA